MAPHGSTRFFGDLALPVDLSNTARLDAWLLDYCRSKGLAGVSTRTIQQYGPGDIRERVAIEAAVRELDDLGRARLIQQGRRKEVRINPAPLDGGAR